MSRFSSGTQRVIRSFVSNMGLEPEFVPGETYGFEFALSGVLSLIPSQDGQRILVCLARSRDECGGIQDIEFLRLAGPDLILGSMLHTAVGENGALMLAIDIEEVDLTLERLDEAANALISYFSALAARGP